MPCKRIQDVAGLRAIYDAAKGILVILTSNNTTLHLPTCRVVGAATSPDGSDALVGDWRWYAGMADAVRDEAPLVFCPYCNPGLIDKTDALNRSGTFLHSKIYRILDNLGYSTTAEHPVYVAPFVQDPSRRPGYGPITVTAEFQRALAESQQGSLARSRILDIVTTVPLSQSLELVLPIEVKKINPDYVDWVFMSHGIGEADMTAVVISAKDMEGPSLFKIPRSDLGRPPLHVNKASVKISRMPIRAYGDAVSLTLSRSSKYEFQKRSLDEAPTQVVEGTFGLITSKLIHQVSTGIGYDITQYYLPIIVTTANLYSCSYDPNNLDMTSGLAANVNLKKEEFLIYDCPSPVTASFPSPLIGTLDRGKDVHRLTKWPVLVVQARSFENLLELIRRVDLDVG